MAFRLDTGGGGVVDLAEPQRDAFPSNLGGAMRYLFVHTVYDILEGLGGGLGSFLAGLGVKFLDRIEPDLVDYVQPIIDLILDAPDLAPELRDLFAKMRDPEHAGGAFLLSGLAGSTVSSVSGNVLAPVLAELTYALNRYLRPALLDQGTFITAYRLGLLSTEQFSHWMATHGLSDEAIDLVSETSRPRPGPSDLVNMYQRDLLNRDQAMLALISYGYRADDASNLIRLGNRNLDPLLAIYAQKRGLLTDEERAAILTANGYTEADAQTLTAMQSQIPGAADLVRFALREAFRDDIAAKWSYDEDMPPEFVAYLGQQGYDPQWATYYWRSHWTLPSISNGFEMFHRGIINQTELEQLLKVSDLPQFWRDHLVDVAYNPLTRVDVRRMYGLGVLNRDDVKRSYLDLGYDDLNAERMTEFTVLYETDDPESKQTEYKALTRSVIIAAYKKGAITRAEAETRLLDIRYPQAEAEFLLELSDWEQELADSGDPLATYQKDIRAIVEKSYSQRIISGSDLVGMMGALGYSEEEANLLKETIDFWYDMDQMDKTTKQIGDAFVNRAYSRSDAVVALGGLNVPSEMQEHLLSQWDTERQHRSRRLTEPQYKKALEAGLIGVGEYTENLRGLGYSEYDIWLLVGLLEDQGEPMPKPLTGPRGF